MAGASFAFHVIARDYFGLPNETIQSMQFVQLATGLQIMIFSCRVESAGFVTHAPSIFLLAVVCAAQFAVALLAVYGSVRAARTADRVGAVAAAIAIAAMFTCVPDNLPLLTLCRSSDCPSCPCPSSPSLRCPTLTAPLLLCPSAAPASPPSVGCTCCRRGCSSR
jgi:hypothetical protein